MSVCAPKTTMLAVLVLVVALPDFNVAVQGDPHVKVVNNLDGGLNLTLSCKYTVGGPNPPRQAHVVDSVLGSGKTQELSLDAELIATTKIDCTFKWAGASDHAYPIFIYGNFGYCLTKCTWSIKQDQPCFTGGDRPLDLCLRWNT